MREPTVFWWPSRIEPSVVMDIGSTLDLMPTIAALSGAQLPTDRTMDGVDLSAALLKGEKSERNEMIYYHGDEVFAIRQGPYKAHFKTKTDFVGQKEPKVHDPPLLYHLEHDPAEKYNIASAHPEIVKQITERKKQHEAGVKQVPNQLTLR